MALTLTLPRDLKHHQLPGELGEARNRTENLACSLPYKLQFPHWDHQGLEHSLSLKEAVDRAKELEPRLSCETPCQHPRS